jgi:hypothetical protein
MLIEQINHVGLQPLQGGLGHIPDVLWPAVQSLAGQSARETELGGDHHLVAERCECFAKEFFVQKWAIGLRCIEECNTAFVGCPNEFDRLFFLCCRAVAETQPHATKAEC